MRVRASKRAKATDISKEVKTLVYERDSGLCVVCGKQGIPNAHYIPRSAGGLGIEQNIVCLCIDCHNAFDFGDKETMDAIGNKIKNYLTSKYPDWDEHNLIYKKYDWSVV